MIVPVLLTAVTMVHALISMPQGFPANSVSVIPDGLEETALDVRKLQICTRVHGISYK